MCLLTNISQTATLPLTLKLDKEELKRISRSNAYFSFAQIFCSWLTTICSLFELHSSSICFNSKLSLIILFSLFLCGYSTTLKPTQYLLYSVELNHTCRATKVISV